MSLGFWLRAFTFTSLIAVIAAKDPRIERATVTRSLIPESIITPPPAFHGDLLKRAIATCGFIRGDSASPLTCGEGYNCVTTLRAIPAFACCNNLECLDNWGACQNFGENNCQGFDLDEVTCSSIYGSILRCSANAPSCFPYARSAARGATDTYYSYACGTASTEVLVLATATNGAITDDPAPAPTDAESIPFAGFPSVPNPTRAPVAASTSSSGQKPSSSNKSVLSTTAIVLIVVFGGGALILALGFGCCCLWRRRRHNNDIVKHSLIRRQKYQKTVTSAPGPGTIINGWDDGNPLGTPGPPASDYSGPTVHGNDRPFFGGLGQRPY